MFVFAEEGKPEILEKNPWNKAKISNKLNPHMASNFKATLGGGEHSHYCTIPAPPPTPLSFRNTLNQEVQDEGQVLA